MMKTEPESAIVSVGSVAMLPAFDMLTTFAAQGRQDVLRTVSTPLGCCDIIQGCSGALVFAAAHRPSFSDSTDITAVVHSSWDVKRLGRMNVRASSALVFDTAAAVRLAKANAIGSLITNSCTVGLYLGTEHYRSAKGPWIERVRQAGEQLLGNDFQDLQFR